MDKNNELYDELCLSVYNTNRYFHRLYQSVLEDFDLTYLQYLSILIVWRHQETQLMEIGKLLDLSSNTLTPVIQKLVKKQWLCKIENPNDKRIKLLTIDETHRHDFELILGRLSQVQAVFSEKTQHDLPNIIENQNKLNKILLTLITKEFRIDESSTN